MLESLVIRGKKNYCKQGQKKLRSKTSRPQLVPSIEDDDDRKRPQLVALTKRLAGSENWPSDLGRESCLCVRVCVCMRSSARATLLTQRRQNLTKKNGGQKRKERKYEKRRRKQPPLAASFFASPAHTPNPSTRSTPTSTSQNTVHTRTRPKIYTPSTIAHDRTNARLRRS